MLDPTIVHTPAGLLLPVRPLPCGSPPRTCSLPYLVAGTGLTRLPTDSRLNATPCGYAAALRFATAANAPLLPCPLPANCLTLLPPAVCVGCWFPTAHTRFPACTARFKPATFWTTGRPSPRVGFAGVRRTSAGSPAAPTFAAAYTPLCHTHHVYRAGHAFAGPSAERLTCLDSGTARTFLPALLPPPCHCPVSYVPNFTICFFSSVLPGFPILFVPSICIIPSYLPFPSPSPDIIIILIPHSPFPSPSLPFPVPSYYCMPT